MHSAKMNHAIIYQFTIDHTTAVLLTKIKNAFEA
jgi:hypothetical protein